MFKYTPTSTNAEQAARDIISVATFIHSTFKNEIWLWRGQSEDHHGLVPGMHTRVLNYARNPHNTFSDRAPNITVEEGTAQLISLAREMGLDRKGDIRLPDMALLANLQHFGAATPLLDVTTDPLIALWMIAFSSAENPEEKDGTSGLLYGIIKPPKDRWISALDARDFSNVLEPSIAESLKGKTWWYEAPDVTERLRIQRGSFIVGPIANPKTGASSTLPLTIDSTGENWVKKRIEKMGEKSNTARRTTDAFAIVVRGSVKKHLRLLLEERSGLTISAVYPIPWDRPVIEQFSRGYGRSRDLALDLTHLFPTRSTTPGSAERTVRSKRAKKAVAGVRRKKVVVLKGKAKK